MMMIIVFIADFVSKWATTDSLGILLLEELI